MQYFSFSAGLYSGDHLLLQKKEMKRNEKQLLQTQGQITDNGKIPAERDFIKMINKCSIHL